MSPPPSLRILMTADAVGGVWTYATHLARALAERGCRVRLVTLGPSPRPDQIDALRRIPGIDVEVTDLALEWMDPEARDFSRVLAHLLDLERRFEPDVVHLNGFREAVALWQAPVLVVAHSCVRSWWRACHGAEPSEPRWLTYAANVRAGLAAAHAWVAPSGAFRDEIEALYTTPRAGRVIYNGIDAPPETPVKEPFILAAGRFWDAAKNVSALAAVASHLSWPVRIAGEMSAPVLSEARPAAPEFLGALPYREMRRQMRRAAIFAAPCVYEPFGLGVLEAAGSGCALVLSDIPSFRELWNGAAVFIDPHDAAGITAALRGVCEDADLRQSLQQAAARRARRYSLAAMADAYLQTYEGMLSRSAGAPRKSEPALLERAS
jgi:glycosyltransferase involved in cell wall biosynthesis